MKGFGLAAMLALAVIASACSSDSTPSSSGTTQPPPPSPTATQTSDDSGGGGGGGAATASLQAGAGGFVFSPTTVSIAEHGVITVKNVGTLPHTFTIQSKGINQVLSAGASAKITIDLAPGTYPFVCTFHQSQGMTGTLTVTD